MHVPRIQAQALRRVGWSIGDQAVSSATNFALMIVVARSVTPAQFGAFALLQGTYFLCVELNRSVTSEPLIVRFCATEGAAKVRATRDSAGANLVFGLVLALLLSIALIFLPAAARSTLAVFTICLPGLLLQDFWRFAFLADRCPRKAFVNDAVWAVLQAVGILALVMLDKVSLTTLVLTWSGSAVVACLYGLRQFGHLPRPSAWRSWYRSHRDLGGRFAIEAAAFQGSGQFVIYALGLFTGLAAVGAFKGAQAVYGPIVVLVLAMRLAALPELVRLHTRRPTQLRTAALSFGGMLLLVSGAWGAVALLLPDSIGTALFGQTWALAEPLILFVVLDRVFHALGFGALLGLRAIGDARRSLRAQVISALLRLSFSLTGAVLGGARGALIAIAIASPLQALVWWHQFSAGLASSRRKPVAPDDHDAVGRAPTFVD